MHHDKLCLQHLDKLALLLVLEHEQYMYQFDIEQNHYLYCYNNYCIKDRQIMEI